LISSLEEAKQINPEAFGGVLLDGILATISGLSKGATYEHNSLDRCVFRSKYCRYAILSHGDVDYCPSSRDPRCSTNEQNNAENPQYSNGE
jgi:hypothetical protein